MSAIGTYAIYLALYVALVGTAVGIVAGLTGQHRYRVSSRFALVTATGAICVASTALFYAFLTHDFSIEYVASFSDRSMPLFYLIGAFWGGQAGSLLLWVTVVGLFSTMAIWTNRDRYPRLMPWVTATCLAVMAGLLIILAFGSNPFEGYGVIDAPMKGEGLTPLLQTPKMVIHPPCLLTGLATMTVPFGFAIAALVEGDTSSKWVKAARKWILIPWLFLTVGNILGGMWAYEELGWGGYWAWDPVENAAFMPWLMATALIHSLMIQERRSMLKRWNLVLMTGTFLLTVFGTYLTRSGLVESIHTFAQGDIGDYFLVFLCVFTGISLILLVWRWSDLRTSRKLKSVASREAAFVVNNWLFLAMTVVVFFGTLWPRIKEWLTGRKVSIGPTWFNQWMIPLGIVLLFLMGVGTVIAWRRSSISKFVKNFRWPVLSTLVCGPIGLAAYWLLRGRDLGGIPNYTDLGYGIAVIIGAVFVISVTVQEFYRGIAARMKGHGESAWQALYQLFAKQRRRYGGYIVHLGVVFAFIAFSGNALKRGRDVTLTQGESAKVADYQITYEGLKRDSNSKRMLVSANLKVERNGEHLYDMHPGRAMFHARPNMPTSEIDIHSTPLEDVYVALVSIDQQTQRISLKMFVSPLTWWFWFAGAVVMIGTLICLWPTNRRNNRRGGRSRVSLVGRAMLAVFLFGVAVSPVVIWHVESSTDWGSAERFVTQQDARPELPPPSSDAKPG